MAKTYKKIEDAFKELRTLGFFAESNHMCCQSCGWSVVPEGTNNTVFYHSQDADDLKDTGSCHLAWEGDGEKIVEVLKKHQIEVEWNGEKTQRILIKI